MVRSVFAGTKISFEKSISVFVVLIFMCFPGFFGARLNTMGYGSLDVKGCSPELVMFPSVLEMLACKEKGTAKI